MAASHESVLIQALEAAATGNVSPDIFTDDVIGWTPNLAVTSRAELEKEWGQRDEALSNVSVAIPGIHVIGDMAIAEFRGDKISSFRCYFDDAALLEQLLF